MTYDQFVGLCRDAHLTPTSTELPGDRRLLALWHDHRGHWDTAHEIAQSIHTAQGSALHAYLHRKEGDLSNAQYWYSRSGRARPSGSLEAEWEALAREFCENT